MIRDITIGQYYPADSRIHKLDPRVKIVCTLLYLISLFTFKSILGYVLATVFLFGCIKLAKVPFKFIVRGLPHFGHLGISSEGISMFFCFFTMSRIIFSLSYVTAEQGTEH